MALARIRLIDNFLLIFLTKPFSRLNWIKGGELKPSDHSAVLRSVQTIWRTASLRREEKRKQEKGLNQERSVEKIHFNHRKFVVNFEFRSLMDPIKMRTDWWH